MTYSRSLLLLLLLPTLACVPAPRPVLVAFDSSLYDVLSDISTLEQQALCQRDFCIETSPTGGRSRLETPVPGWSTEKSIDFHQKLLPAAEGGKQFNQILGTWRPGTPMPLQLHAMIVSISNALLKITLDFPDGDLKAKILANFNRVQQAVLNAIDLYLSIVSTATPSTDPLRAPMRQP